MQRIIGFVFVLLMSANVVFAAPRFNLPAVQAPPPAGSNGGVCRMSGSPCDSNLVCAAGVCIVPPPAGGIGQACLPNRQCNHGLNCAGPGTGLCIAPPTQGSNGGACFAGGGCNPGLSCLPPGICKHAGATGQPCRADGTCNSGMFCGAGICVQQISEGGTCLSSDMCKSGMSCVGGRCSRMYQSSEPAREEPVRTHRTRTTTSQ